MLMCKILIGWSIDHLDYPLTKPLYILCRDWQKIFQQHPLGIFCSRGLIEFHFEISFMQTFAHYFLSLIQKFTWIHKVTLIQTHIHTLFKKLLTLFWVKLLTMLQKRKFQPSFQIDLYFFSMNLAKLIWIFFYDYVCVW